VEKTKVARRVADLKWSGTLQEGVRGGNEKLYKYKVTSEVRMKNAMYSDMLERLQSCVQEHALTALRELQKDPNSAPMGYSLDVLTSHLSYVEAMNDAAEVLARLCGESAGTVEQALWLDEYLLPHLEKPQRALGISRDYQSLSR